MDVLNLIMNLSIIFQTQVRVAELNRIGRDYSRTLDRLQKALECSLNTGCTSWASIVQALRSPLINMDGLANEIARNHPSTFSMWLVFLCGGWRSPPIEI